MRILFALMLVLTLQVTLARRSKGSKQLAIMQVKYGVKQIFNDTITDRCNEDDEACFEAAKKCVKGMLPKKNKMLKGIKKALKQVWEDPEFAEIKEEFANYTMDCPEMQKFMEASGMEDMGGSMPYGASGGSMPYGASGGSMPYGASGGSMPYGASGGSMPYGAYGGTKATDWKPTGRRGPAQIPDDIKNKMNSLVSSAGDADTPQSMKSKIEGLLKNGLKEVPEGVKGEIENIVKNVNPDGVQSIKNNLKKMAANNGNIPQSIKDQINKVMGSNDGSVTSESIKNKFEGMLNDASMQPIKEQINNAFKNADKETVNAMKNKIKNMLAGVGDGEMPKSISGLMQSMGNGGSMEAIKNKMKDIMQSSGMSQMLPTEMIEQSAKHMKQAAKKMMGIKMQCFARFVNEELEEDDVEDIACMASEQLRILKVDEESGDSELRINKIKKLVKGNALKSAVDTCKDEIEEDDGCIVLEFAECVLNACIDVRLGVEEAE